MSVAFVFPGQGSQEAGMGRALAEAFPESRAVFDEADAGAGLRALAAVLRGARGRAAAHGQHAAGDPGHQHRRAARRSSRAGSGRPGSPATAWASTRRSWRRARCRSPTRCATVRRRGQYMQEAVPAGRRRDGRDPRASSWRRSSRPAARRPQGEVVSPANVNSPGQVVIAGHAGGGRRGRPSAARRRARSARCRCRCRRRSTAR